MEITLKQAQALVEAFGGDEESTITVVSGNGHSGKGLYVCATDYPEEGSAFIGAAE